MATIHDTFTRADSDTLGTSSEGWSWLERGGDVDILSNQAQGGAPGFNWAAAQFDLDSADHYAQVIVVAHGGDAGPMVRVDTATDSFYTVFCGTLETRLFRVLSGSFVQVGASGPAVATGSVVKVQAVGDQITVYDDGVAIIGPETNSEITGFTRTGMTAVDSTASLDDFEAGDITSALLWTPQLPVVGGAKVDVIPSGSEPR